MASGRGPGGRFRRFFLLVLLGLSSPFPAVGAGGSEGGDPLVCRHDAIKRHYLDADWDGFLEQYRDLPLNDCPHVLFLLARTLFRGHEFDLLGYARAMHSTSRPLTEWGQVDVLRRLLESVGFTSEDAADLLRNGRDLKMIGSALLHQLAKKGYGAAVYERGPNASRVDVLGLMSEGLWQDEKEQERLAAGVRAASLEAATRVIFSIGMGRWNGAGEVAEAAERLLLAQLDDGFLAAALWLRLAYDAGGFGGARTEKAKRVSEIADSRLYWPVGSPIPLPIGMTLEQLKRVGSEVGAGFRDLPWDDDDAPIMGTRLCDPSEGKCVLRLVEAFYSCQMRNMALVSRTEVVDSKIHDRCIANSMALFRVRQALSTRDSPNSYAPHRLAPLLPRLPYERDIVR